MTSKLRRKWMLAAAIVLLLPALASFFSPLFSRETENWLGFYPLQLGDHWEYDVVYKGKDIKGVVDVTRSYTEDGQEYFVMRDASQDVEYHIGINEHGVLLRRWRYPFPVLRFLKYTVKFEPPIPIIDYPLEVGKRWVYVGRGSVWFMGKNVSISYQVEEEDDLQTAIGSIHYFKISGLVDDSSSLYEELYYYGQGYGYIKGQGRERKDMITAYGRAAEDATGEDREEQELEAASEAAAAVEATPGQGEEEQVDGPAPEESGGTE